MKLTYTGKQVQLSPVLEKKVAARLARLSKVLERRGEKEANVVFQTQRHLQKAEVTVNYYDHALVAVGSATDQGSALLDAFDRLEKQALKMRERWRDIKRTPEGKVSSAAPEAPVKSNLKPAKPAKTVRLAAKPNGKPMTVEEAMINIDDKEDYMVYHDSETDKSAVLVRLRDGSLRRVEP